MKKFIASILLLTTLVVAFGAFTKEPQDQPKMYTVSLPLSDWFLLQQILTVPDDVTANQKKYILEKMAVQVNGQIKADSTAKK